MLLHPLTKTEIKRHYQNEFKFKKFYLRVFYFNFFIYNSQLDIVLNSGSVESKK